MVYFYRLLIPGQSTKAE